MARWSETGLVEPTIARNERRVVSFDIHIAASDDDSSPADATDYVITVNGRVIKRMNAWQLARLVGPSNRG